MNDRRLMAEAVALAEKGRGFTAPNPMVGCVIARDDAIVGRGYHARYGSCHAEVMALNEARARARGATMYTTLEPCNHTGRTPPCTDAIIKAGIARLVVALRDPNPVSKCDSGRVKLERAGIKVEFGLMEAEVLRQNEVYFHALRHGAPFVALKLACTLDGKLADFQGQSQWITSEPAREYVHHLRAEYSAVLVGQRTVQTDNPRLTCRLRGRPNPVRVVLDPDLTLPTSARVFSRSGRTFVFCVPGLPARRRRPFERKGIEIHEVGTDRDGLLVWPEILTVLQRQGITSVMVEGGAKVTASALNAGVVNKIYLFFAPMILGGGVSFSEELIPRRLSQALALKDWRFVPVGRDLLIEAYL